MKEQQTFFNTPQDSCCRLHTCKVAECPHVQQCQCSDLRLTAAEPRGDGTMADGIVAQSRSGGKRNKITILLGSQTRGIRLHHSHAMLVVWGNSPMLSPTASYHLQASLLQVSRLVTFGFRTASNPEFIRAVISFLSHRTVLPVRNIRTAEQSPYCCIGSDRIISLLYLC